MNRFYWHQKTSQIAVISWYPNVPQENSIYRPSYKHVWGNASQGLNKLLHSPCACPIGLTDFLYWVLLCNCFMYVVDRIRNGNLLSQKFAKPQPQTHIQKLQGLINIGPILLLRWLPLHNFFVLQCSCLWRDISTWRCYNHPKNVEIDNHSNGTYLSSKTHLADLLCVCYMILIDCLSNIAGEWPTLFAQNINWLYLYRVGYSKIGFLLPNAHILSYCVNGVLITWQS